MSVVKVTLSESQKLDTALSFLGWSLSKYDTLRKTNLLETKIIEEITEKMLKIPKGEGVEINYSEQWAYGVLLMNVPSQYQDL